MVSGLAADFEFHKLYEDFADTDFHSVVSQIFDSDDYVGATLRAIFQIRMKAKDFLNVEPWFVTTSTAPPSSLDKNDYRQQMFENATANFTIETLDGPIETVRYLLYLTVDEIRVLVNEDPSIRAVTANFRKQIVQEVLLISY
ncbi:unnamed protein product [Toxocara canis]|uniref:Uncharacterized protein n=1 Tax=Toxocara canis TaxID=6265 RepID=A0A3P7FQG6_TOXCA|nr:unnamed protein product [Toxocara canis]